MSVRSAGGRLIGASLSRPVNSAEEGVDFIDSAGKILYKDVYKRQVCVFVDHGFMRKNEGDEIEKTFSKLNLTFVRVNAGERFAAKLKGVTDPEQKRKLIGEEFILSLIHIWRPTHSARPAANTVRRPAGRGASAVST